MDDEIVREGNYGDVLPPDSTFIDNSGFPFEDDMFKKSGNIRSHLDDLAKKHPEFATKLHGPPLGNEAGPSNTDWEHAYTIPVSIEKSNTDKTGSQPQDSSVSSSDSYNTNNSNNANQPSGSQGYLNQHGLRNTVDIGEQVHKAAKQENESQKRSCSAPPDGSVAQQEPKRFTSKIEITPVNPFENEDTKSDSTCNSSSAAKSPQQSQESSPQLERKQHSNVRHIPIFVEGRRDPVVPKPNNMGNSMGSVPGKKPPTQDQTPLKRKLETAGSSPRPQPQQMWEKNTPTKDEVDGHFHPPQQTSKSPQKEPPKRLSPLQQIEEVQKEVDELGKRVESFNGKDRLDKEYLFLDEMLTRNLIKLDVVEVNGNEELRAARKNAIKTIQKYVSILESKVPSTDTSGSGDAGDIEMTSPGTAYTESSSMSVDNQEPQAESFPSSSVSLQHQAQEDSSTPMEVDQTNQQSEQSGGDPTTKDTKLSHDAKSSPSNSPSKGKDKKKGGKKGK